MSVGDWVAVTSYFVLVVLVGSGCIRLARLPPSHLLRDWSACYLAGQIVLLLLTLSTGFVPWTHDHLLPAVVVIAVVVACADASRVRSGWRVALVVLATVGSLLLTIALFPSIAMLVHRTPAIETDARGIWLFHGKALFTASGIAPAFFTDPLHWWSSPDYPLLLPAQAAWSSLLVGRWGELSCRAFLLFHFAAWFRLVHLTLTAKGYPWWLALFLTGAFLCQGVSWFTPGFAYVSGQADYHCFVPLALAMLVLAVPVATAAYGNHRAVEDHRSLVVLLLAYAACTKSEGTAFAALFAGSWLAWSAVRCARLRGLRALVAAIPAARTLWIFAGLCGLLPVALWAIFKALHGMGSNLHLLERATTPGLLGELLSARLPTVLRSVRDNGQMQDTYGLLIVLLALVACSVVLRFFGKRSVGTRRAEALAALAWLVVVVLICMTYVLTPHDYLFHMQTSVTRLLFFPHLIVFVLCVFRLDVLWEAISPWLRSSPISGVQPSTR